MQVGFTALISLELPAISWSDVVDVPFSAILSHAVQYRLPEYPFSVQVAALTSRSSKGPLCLKSPVLPFTVPPQAVQR